VLPLPRRRVDPEVVRERLRALAAGGAEPLRAQGLAAFGLATDDAPEGDEVPPAAVRTSLRPVVVAVAATALAAWGVVHLTSGGTPSRLELAPGTPVPSVSGVLTGPSSGASGGAPSDRAAPSVVTDPALAVGDVVVQVVGQVRHPGLVTVPHGSRVADAIAAAGGLARGGSSGGLNLGRLLVDGEQVVVSPDAVPSPAPSSTGGGATAVVDLNAATVSDLDTLPGVGPVMAARILDWRTAHGRFTSVDQLREVSGIGARTFERLKPHVRV
jgi:competence protein ComEA